MKPLFFTFFLILFILISQPIFSQSAAILRQGDSLFALGNYTRAEEKYDQLLQQHLFSPNMLLKLAYIEENKKDFVLTLYYLSLYYNYRPDIEIHKKMESLAKETGVQGYEYTDFEYVTFLYRQYYYFILLLLLTISGFYFTHLVLKKIRDKNIGVRILAFFLMLLTVFYMLNFELTTPKAIVQTPDALIMSYSSAASDVINRAKAGERVNIIEKSDIWYKIKTNGKIGYMKESDLLPIEKPSEKIKG
jgi:hypothetical protein